MTSHPNVASTINNIANAIKPFQEIRRLTSASLTPLPPVSLDHLLKFESLAGMHTQFDLVRGKTFAGSKRIKKLREDVIDVYGWHIALVLTNVRVEASELSDVLSKDDQDLRLAAQALLYSQIIGVEYPDSKGANLVKIGFNSFLANHSHLVADRFLPETLDDHLLMAARNLLRPARMASEIDYKLATTIRDCTNRLPEERTSTHKPYARALNPKVRDKTIITQTRPAEEVRVILRKKGYTL
jgi:hypothetical protein